MKRFLKDNWWIFIVIFLFITFSNAVFQWDWYVCDFIARIYLCITDHLSLSTVFSL